MSSVLEERLILQVVTAGLPMPAREWKPFREVGWRFDLAWTERLLAVEVEGGTWIRESRSVSSSAADNGLEVVEITIGGRHQRGKGYTEDCRKYDLAALLGWMVLRFTRDMIESGEAIQILEAAFGKRDPRALLAKRAEDTAHRRSQGAKIGWAVRKQKEKQG